MQIHTSMAARLRGGLVLLCLVGTPISQSEAAQDASPASASFYATQFEKKPDVAAMSALGRQLFSDPSLSASGKVSCASCHSPAHAYGPPDGKPVRVAGGDMQQLGTRAAPSLRYLQAVPSFSEHYTEDEGARIGQDQGPAGGHTWDGRASSVHDQARLPLFSKLEMANASEDAVVAKVRKGSYATQFRNTFGEHVFDQSPLAFKGVLMALEVFQQEARDFYPYDSKYDAYLRGQVKLSEREAHGLALFNDKTKGNCSNCHFSGFSSGAFPAFSDFGFIALGVPRNEKIPANHDAKYFDLGLCGPARTDLKAHPEYCGLFRTPSLRNVATRKVFFHNGQFNDLRKVIEFYVQRDINPGKWYPRKADGSVDKFNDMPAQYRGNINVEPPFNRKPGDAPALTDAEITDVIAFLKTLNDGYVIKQ